MMRICAIGLPLSLIAAAVTANQPPEVLDIEAAPTPTVGGQTVHMVGHAIDPEGQSLTFHWSTEDGTLSGVDDLDAEVDWTLPNGEGNFMISLEVRDPEGNATAAERLFPIGPIHPHRSFTGPLLEPARVAVDDQGDVWVTDWGRAKVVHFNADGEFLDEFSTAPRPLGIAVVDGSTLLVGEDSFDRVARYRMDGELLGLLGSGEGEIEMPNAIAIDPGSGRIHVVDSMGDEVRIYTADGVLDSILSPPGLIEFPVDIAVDGATQEVYVADQGASKIYVFNSDGLIVRTFGSRGITPGKFMRIQGMALDEAGQVLALDSYLSNIQVFDPSGTHLATFGHVGDWEGAMRTPLGLSAVPGEQIFVTSGGTGEIEVFAHWAWSVTHPIWTGQGTVIW